MKLILCVTSFFEGQNDKVSHSTYNVLFEDTKSTFCALIFCSNNIFIYPIYLSFQCQVIDEICNAIRQSKGLLLIKVNCNSSTNRTIYTFVGEADDLVEGALNASKVAHKLIDISNYCNSKRSLGVLDDCQFIPVNSVDIQQSIYCARKFGNKLAESLDVPVYLYGYASIDDDDDDADDNRKEKLIRSFKYDQLKDILFIPQWTPDFGPGKFVPNWGVSLVGAKKLLIEYNVNLIATKEQAHRIALNMREKGQSNSKDNLLKGTVELSSCLVKEHSLVQVTTKLLDYTKTGIHNIFEEVKKNAKELDLPVVGSQIVSFVPLKCILLSAEYYIEKENLFILEEEQKIRLVIDRLGLSSIESFNVKDKIIDYIYYDKMSQNGGKLIDLTLYQFICSVGDRTTAPGGGSVAATVGSLGCALASMVGKMSFGRKMYQKNDKLMRKLIPIFHETMKNLTKFIDADTNAYSDYLSAIKLPKSTDQEIAVRDAAIEIGIKNAVEVPLNLSRSLFKLWQPTIELAKVINKSSTSDLEVGVNCIYLAILSSHYNIFTNLNDTSDSKYKEVTSDEMNKIKIESQNFLHQLLTILAEKKKSF